MRLKIFKNFFVTTACIFFITLTLLFVIMSFVLSGYITETKKDLLNKTVLSVGELIEEEADKETLGQNISTVSKINDVDIFISDYLGNIVICSCAEFESENHCEHCSSPIDKDILSGIDVVGGFSISTMNGRFERLSYVWSREIVKPAENSGVFLFVTASTVTATEMLSLLFRIYAISALIPLILMFFAEYILTYRLTKPLKYMSVAARSIAKGDFSKRVPVMSEDEIGELSVLFNRMTDALAKNESVRRNFVSNISHELKTPMTTIGGFIDGIIDGTIDESRRDYYLKIVSDEVKRLSRLVSSMLSIAKLESDDRVLNPSEFDFAELILSVVVSMEQRITDKSLTVEGLDRLSHTLVYADKDLIYQVVYNLVDNAVKYSTEKGRIVFSAHRIADKLSFAIGNDGVGIPEADIPHIFERFYKTDKSRSGNKDSLGLGLYISKTIVDLHDGEISVSSDDNGFVRFEVSLPVNNKNKIQESFNG